MKQSELSPFFFEDPEWFFWKLDTLGMYNEKYMVEESCNALGRSDHTTLD